MYTALIVYTMYSYVNHNMMYLSIRISNIQTKEICELRLSSMQNGLQSNSQVIVDVEQKTCTKQ